MLFIDLLNNLSDYKISGSQNINISSIEYNSNDVKKDSLFVAVRGLKNDGHNFIPEAIKKGASCILVDDIGVFNELRKQELVTAIYVNNSSKSMGYLANAFYGFPSSNMCIIGITGTNGKTTTTYLLKSILETFGKKVGVIGTIGYWINKKFISAEKTTPESVKIFELLSEMRKEGVEYVIMEVSSIALALNRVFSLKYDIAAFTNLTQDHLDFHITFENYFYSKKILFDENLKSNGIALYNADDSYGFKIVSGFDGIKYSYGLTQSDFQAEIIEINFNGITINIRSKDTLVKIQSELTGKFNVYNILLAYSISKLLDVPDECIIDGIKEVKNIEGRFKKITSDNGFLCIVDYSHTPDSLKNALETINQIKNNNSKVITVFGCGGNRDKTKRPIMGKIASDFSDIVILTSDNPRYEEPEQIIKDIFDGITIKEKVIIEPDRKKAITKGIELAEKGDIVLVAGKGHESYQEIKGVKNHFDDSEIIYELLYKK